jgi:3,4-dihydroxy 2-butanone 4-phosphate synthase/GTP cyclohydrolase II
MNTPIIQQSANARIPTSAGTFQLYHYTNDRDDKEHLALVMGDVGDCAGVLVRVHSECMTGDVFGSLRCDCGEQLHAAMQQIAAEGRGVIVYLRQEGRGIGLAQKLRAYNLQDEGYDTVDANLLLGHQADERTYWAAVGILEDLQVRSVRLLTNNPSKIEHLREQGINVVERVPLEPSILPENAAYLETKVRRMRHLLRLPAAAPATTSGQSLSPELAQRVDALRYRAHAYAEERGLPFVTLSYAQSLDGSIAAARGEPLALSGPHSMTLTHALRSAHDAILVGVGTVLADDPRLTVRLVAGPDPQPIVLDTHLRTPVTAGLLNHPSGLWIATSDAGSAKAADLRESAKVRLLEVGTQKDGRIDLPALLHELGRLGIRSVMVEGGAQVLGSFLTEQLAQAAVITVVPRFVGGLPAVGAPKGGGGALFAVGRNPALEGVSYTPAGADLVVWGEFAWPPTAPQAEISTKTARKSAQNSRH